MLKVGDKYTVRHDISNCINEQFKAGETLEIVKSQPKKYTLFNEDGSKCIILSLDEVFDFLVEYEAPLAKLIREGEHVV